MQQTNNIQVTAVRWKNECVLDAWRDNNRMSRQIMSLER